MRILESPTSTGSASGPPGPPRCQSRPEGPERRAGRPERATETCFPRLERVFNNMCVLERQMFARFS